MYMCPIAVLSYRDSSCSSYILTVPSFVSTCIYISILNVLDSVCDDSLDECIDE